MNVYFSGIAGSALLLILTLVSGILLSQLGRPYHTVIFNAHKLIAVGAIFVFVRNIYRLQHGASLRAFVGPGLLLIIGLLFLTLIISGSLLSLQNGGLLALQMPMLKAIHMVHQATPLLALIAAGLALTLLTRSVAI